MSKTRRCLNSRLGNRHVGWFEFAITRWILLCGLFAIPGHCLAQANGDLDDLQTVAEASDYRATSRSGEVTDFMQACDAHADHVTLYTFGETVQGLPMTAALIANPPYQSDQPDERLVALVIANIHSGECSGKEAMLKFMRELSIDAEHPLLDSMMIVLVPNYNADANDMVDTGNRPRQVGPELGMGRRENAQGFDLNRDFMKLESPEARALIGLMNEFDPHLFIDCHTTNGSQHRYCLTYDIPHNPAAPAGIREYLREVMMPAVTDSVRERGKEMFYYGNFDRNRTRWSTYGYQPRYSTEYGGLRGCLAILSEAYSYISYQERIDASYDFVTSCLRHAASDRETIRALVADERAKFVAATETRDPQDDPITLPLGCELIAFDQPTTILGYDGEEDAEFEVEFFGRYLPIDQREIPYAYLVPGEFTEVIQTLQTHGIQVDRLTADHRLSVESLVCERIRQSTRAFQGHRMMSVLGTPQEEELDIPRDTYVVRTSQPLGMLAAYLLDPRSDDGLTTWNFFDEAIEEGAKHPVLAVVAPAPLTTSPVDPSSSETTGR